MANNNTAQQELNDLVSVVESGLTGERRAHFGTLDQHTREAFAIEALETGVVKVKFVLA